MKPIRMFLTIMAALLSAPLFANEWTTAYACLGRTSYLAGETVAPPFAVAWEYAAKSDLLAAPLVAMDRAFITTKGLHVTSLELGTGKIVWAFEGSRAPEEIISFDSVTGKIRWRDRVDAPIVHTPQIGYPVVYVGSAAGTLTAFNQNDGHRMWSVSLGSPLTLPAVDATLLVAGSGTVVAGLRPADGTTVFRTDLGAPLAFFPVLDNAGIIVPLAGAVVVLDRAGKELWRVPSGKPVSAPLAVTLAGILVGSADGTVRLLSRADGHALWEVVLAGTPSALSGSADTVYVGTRQGTLVGLRLSDGAKLWSAALGHGTVLGASLAGGSLLVTAGSWLGALVPAPEPPSNLGLKKDGDKGILTWDAPAANVSPISVYRVWRRRGGSPGPAGTVAAGNTAFTDRLLPGEVAYAVSAVAANGAESARSGEVSLVKGEHLLRRLAVSPVPFDPKRGILTVSFELGDAARVAWSIVDAEGAPVMDERTALLPKGPGAVTWDGTNRLGQPVERGTLQVRLKASASGENDADAKAFPVDWRADAPASSPSGGPVQAATAGGGSPGAAAGNGPSGTSSGGTADSGVDSGGGTGHHDNGVRDHGQGEGRDGAGQGKGQGSDNGKK